MNIATTIYLFISPTLPYFPLYGCHLWLIPVFNPYLSISLFQYINKYLNLYINVLLY